MDKINKQLLSFVSSMEENEKEIELVVYCYDTNRAGDCLSKMKDVVLTQKFPFIHAVGVRAKMSIIKKIANISEVKHITYSTKVFAQMEKSKKAINVSAFHNEGFFGSGVNIAVIDTGCFSHFDLTFPENKIVCFMDLVASKKNSYDDNGHGTFVCGIISGSGLLSGFKYSGVAPKSNLIVIKALNENGETSAFQILEAMQWVYDNRQKYNIKVVCMSFGSSPLGAGDPLVSGAEKLWRAGIVVVVAGGNSGPDEKTIKSPGVSQRVITVGALDCTRKGDFKVASFSSRGPTNFGTKPDVLAPGVNIISTDENGEGYKAMSGTSMSTPIVAGICALMLEKWPILTPDQIKMKLMQSGNKIVFDRNVEGAGLINCLKIT